MDKKLLKKAFAKIDGYRDEMIDVQTKLTAIPALAPVNGGEGEWKKSEFFKGWLQSSGIFDKIDQYDSPDPEVPSGKRPNLVAMMKGASSARRVWVMGHLDIVPPGDLAKWSSDPYKVKVEDGKIFGRGVEDNQHGIVTPLFAAKALRELGATPPYDIGLILVADEETGSKHGIQFLLNRHGDIFQKNDFIVVPDAGVPDGTMIEVAEKSIFWGEAQREDAAPATPADTPVVLALNVQWDGRETLGSSVSAGIYFYRLTAGKRSITKKLVLLLTASC